MPKYFILSFILVSACATKSPVVNSSVPKDPKATLDLGKALSQEHPETLKHLRGISTSTPYTELDVVDPMKSLPVYLKAERSIASSNKDKNEQFRYLRQFREWSFNKKTQKAKSLLENFTCAQVIETQSMGYSLERNFPEDEAMTLSVALHEKVLTCPDYSSEESLFKLTAFSLLKNDCSKANEYLNKFPQPLNQGTQDRVSYLYGFCPQGVKAPIVSQSNPWGGYGVLLSDLDTVLATSEKKKWYLGAQSGIEEWDRLLLTVVDLTEQNKPSLVRHIAHKLDYEKFKKLPVDFQTSMLVLFSYNGADLTVFQALHNYLSENLNMNSAEVAGLLFPVRYWKEIVQNSDQKVDPILVKSLIRQESAFNPHAKSRVKASGLMQLMYPTAKIFGVSKSKDLLDPEINIKTGSRFLHKLVEEFGSVELALAAYNAGPGVVREWIKRYPTKDINLFVEMIPYSETRAYVRLVMRNYKIYQNVLLKHQQSDLKLSQNR